MQVLNPNPRFKNLHSVQLIQQLTTNQILSRQKEQLKLLFNSGVVFLLSSLRIQ